MSALRIWLLATLLVVAVIPPVVFYGAGLSASMSMGDVTAALMARYTERRNNMAMVGLLNLVPLVAHGLLLALHRWRNFPAEHRRIYAGAGAVPVVLVALFVNASFWPLFLPAQQTPGFPHGLEFVVGPLLFAPIGIAVAWFAVYIVLRRSSATTMR